jgi:hypothetical protein
MLDNSFKDKENLSRILYNYQFYYRPNPNPNPKASQRQNPLFNIILVQIMLELVI